MIKPLPKESNAVLAIFPLISVDIFDQIYKQRVSVTSQKKTARNGHKTQFIIL